jgi:hypothetical protein
MKEQQRQLPNQNKISLRRHPILAGRLAWTDKRIASFENRGQQANRILSLSHVTEGAKKEARLNSGISKTRLFDLRKHREDLLSKAQSRR